MIKCRSCGTDNLDNSRYCDECGAKLAADSSGVSSGSKYEPNTSGNPGFRGASVTSVGIPPLIEADVNENANSSDSGSRPNKGTHAKLVIERGGSANTEFFLSSEESNIGRWDADNGIFPDVDLDAHDPDAKVSRRHARIVHRNNVHMIEDLGSTNGTFINRGRRLLPGSPQVLTEGDEIIVGKTFLRFHLTD